MPIRSTSSINTSPHHPPEQAPLPPLSNLPKLPSLSQPLQFPTQLPPPSKCIPPQQPKMTTLTTTIPCPQTPPASYSFRDSNPQTIYTPLTYSNNVNGAPRSVASVATNLHLTPEQSAANTLANFTGVANGMTIPSSVPLSGYASAPMANYCQPMTSANICNYGQDFGSNIHASSPGLIGYTDTRPGYIGGSCTKSTCRKGGRNGKSPKKMHLCSYCSKPFTKQSNKKIHERLHTQTYPYICRNGKCGKRFMWRSSINFHEKNCMGREGLSMDMTPYVDGDERKEKSLTSRAANYSKQIQYVAENLGTPRHGKPFQQQVLEGLPQVIRKFGGNMPQNMSQGFQSAAMSAAMPASMPTSMTIPTSMPTSMAAPIGIPEVSLPGTTAQDHESIPLGTGF